MSRLHTTNLGSLVSVNGIQVPKGCSTLSITYQDTSDSDSGRSPLTGSMWKGYIGTLRTLKCAWNSLYPDHTRKILQAVKGLNRFPVQFYDPESGEYVTADFYVGDRTTDIKTFWRNHELIGLSLTLIENDPYADGNGDTGEGGGIVPEGTITITNNGLHEVTRYEMADVKVPPYGEGEVQIKTNGRHSVSGKAVAVVNVPAGGGGITPSGTIEIDSNGKHDVTDYAEADVQVPPYGVGEIEINDNGRIDVSGKATAVVNVPKGINPEGKITITENGVKDVTAYAQADVQVPPYGDGDVEIKENGTHNVSGKARAIVNVEASGLDMSDPDVVYKATRPADWMLMPDPAEDEIYLLCMIPDGLSAWFACKAVTSPGTEYSIDIGVVGETGAYVQKASIATVASNTVWRAEIAAASWMPVTSDGMAQCLMRVSGDHIKQWYPEAIVESKSSEKRTYGGPIVDLVARCSYATRVSTVSQYEGSTDQKGIESIVYYAWFGSPETGVKRDPSYMFKERDSLIAVREIDLSGSTFFSKMFSGCTSLMAVPDIDLSEATNISGMYYKCSALDRINIYAPKATQCYNVLAQCTAVRSASVRIGSPDNPGTNIGSAMSYMRGLQSIKDTWLYLKPLSGTNTGMYSKQISLTRVNFGMGSETGINGYDIDFSASPLGHAAIREMIDSLPTITAAKKITITGCPGAAEVTEDDVAAAAAKNWTLVYTSASTTSDEPDIPDAQALAIITGEEV